MGPKASLSNAVLYGIFQDLVGARKFRKTVAEQYLRCGSGDRFLDIGCGTGDVLEWLPGVDYQGFDLSSAYINRAVKKYGTRGHFEQRDVSSAEIEPCSFDKVLAMGILHHLTDDEALKLFQLAHAVLKPGCQLVTVDACYAKNQSVFARYLISKDRGCHLRSLEDYRQLATLVFSNTKTDLRHDLLRIPYTHLIMRMEK